MLISRRFLIIPWLAVAAGVGAAPDDSAQLVNATVTTVQVEEKGGLIDVQFVIKVTNGELTVAKNVVAKLPDQSLVYFGDIPAGGSAVSSPQARTFDVSAWPTRHVPMRASLTFALAGAAREVDSLLVVRRRAPAGLEQ